MLQRHRHAAAAARAHALTSGKRVDGDSSVVRRRRQARRRTDVVIGRCCRSRWLVALWRWWLWLILLVAEGEWHGCLCCCRRLVTARDCCHLDERAALRNRVEQASNKARVARRRHANPDVSTVTRFEKHFLWSTRHQKFNITHAHECYRLPTSTRDDTRASDIVPTRSLQQSIRRWLRNESTPDAT